MNPEILDTLNVLCPAGIVEVRLLGALTHKKAVVAGYYDREHFAQVARDIARYPKAQAVYVTLNEIEPALLARCANRLDQTDRTTADANVVSRRFLLIDCDPKRPSGVSATEAEHQAGLLRCKGVARFLREQGWPDPIFGDSGNGGHLLYPIVLPNTPESTELIKSVLFALAARFDDATVQVDTSVYNAARISKLYGTWARKGDNTPERPHRPARLLHVPDWAMGNPSHPAASPHPDGRAVPPGPEGGQLLGAIDRPDGENTPERGDIPVDFPGPGGNAQPNVDRPVVHGGESLVPRAALVALAAEYERTQAGKPSPAYAPLPPFDMEAWLVKTGLSLSVNDPLPYQGGRKWQLTCPFNPDHTAPDAILTLSASGAPGFHCSHTSCQSYDFAALRDKREPGWRNAGVSGEKRDRNLRASRIAAFVQRFENEPEDEEAEPGDGDEGDDTRGMSVPTRLVELVRERARLWKTPEGVTYATLKMSAQVAETWPIHSSGFKRLTRRLYYEQVGRAPSASALGDALGVLDAIADAHGQTQTAHNRKAFLVTKDGPVLYIDLCDDQWRMVRVTPAGWSVVRQTLDQPVRFKRAGGMLPLPVPVGGGEIGELRRFVNVAPGDPDNPGDFALLVSWLLAALGPHRPYPVLNLSGEQGSAKSSTARTLRALVDPAKPALRPTPSDEQDIAIACNNAFTVAYDNLSFMPNWLSDALCRVSTGGGFGARRLYTNDEEALFDFMAPVILTGIGESASRPDLLERSLLLTLPTIPDDARQDEDEMGTVFERARPRLLGALLDAVAHGLRHLPTTRLDRKPRMADFARWVSACETGGKLGWRAGAFLDVYEANREAGTELSLEGTALAPLLTRLLTEITGDGSDYLLGASPHLFEGTAAELLQAVTERASDRDRKRLPANPRSLSIALRRIEPALRRTGIMIEHLRTNNARLIRIYPAGVTQTRETVRSVTQIGDANPAASPVVPSQNDARDANDAKKQPPLTALEETKKEEKTTGEPENEDAEKRVGSFASLRHTVTAPVYTIQRETDDDRIEDPFAEPDPFAINVSAPVADTSPDHRTSGPPDRHSSLPDLSHLDAEARDNAIRAAVQAALNGTMPAHCDPADAPRSSIGFTTTPVSHLLHLLEKARQLRTEHGADYITTPTGAHLAADIEAIAAWWLERNNENAPRFMRGEL